MPITLSCADYTWPAVPHELALDIVAGLGFTAVDLGYMYGRSHVRPEEAGADIAAWAGRIGERCAARGLAVADVFYQAPDFETWAVSHPDAAEIARGAGPFAGALELARRLGSPGVTILPGVVHPGDTYEAAVSRAAVELRRRVEMAGEAGLRLSVEPHQGSIADTPDRTAALVERVPGLTLTLDYGHFTYAGIDDDAIEPLIEHAGHVQCRGGAPGVLQAGMRTNTIDFPRMTAALLRSGYPGYVACEYVWSEWMDCDKVDNLTETAALRDILRG